MKTENKNKVKAALRDLIDLTDIESINVQKLEVKFADANLKIRFVEKGNNVLVQVKDVGGLVAEMSDAVDAMNTVIKKYGFLDR